MQYYEENGRRAKEFTISMIVHLNFAFPPLCQFRQRRRANGKQRKFFETFLREQSFKVSRFKHSVLIPFALKSSYDHFTHVYAIASIWIVSNLILLVALLDLPLNDTSTSGISSSSISRFQREHNIVTVLAYLYIYCSNDAKCNIYIYIYVYDSQS